MTAAAPAGIGTPLFLIVGAMVACMAAAGAGCIPAQPPVARISANMLRDRK
jgi:hypothetical protein